MVIIIENGEVYAPRPLGKVSILVVGGKILKVGQIDKAAVDSLGVEFDVIDAAECLVTPGLIDPHQHLLGGSGEDGFSTQTPEIHAVEIVSAGITTVVGCLGVDTTMKTMPGLLAKAKALKEEGLSAFLWSGGYKVPPATITSSVCDDIMFVEEIIGAGEIAIADERSHEPTVQELARLVSDAHVGGMLSKKAGLTHFHVGEGTSRLQKLRELVDDKNVTPDWLYPTHIGRSEELLREAIDLSKRGCFVDFDTVDENLPEFLKSYERHGGDFDKLTLSSDSSLSSPLTLFEQIRLAVMEHGFPFDQVLRLATSNTARALKLHQKGEIKEGKAADIVVLEKDSMKLREVISNGRRLYMGGRPAFKEAFLKDSNRSIRLEGEKEIKSVTRKSK